MPTINRPSQMPAQMHSNIEGDTVCAEVDLIELVELVEACTTAECAEEAYEEWRSKFDRSKVSRTDAMNVPECGRLHYAQAFYSFVVNLIESRHSVGLVTESDVEQAIACLSGQPATFTLTEAQLLFETYIRDLPIYWTYVWLFLLDDKIDEANDLGKITCLPWRLGLDRVTSGSRYIRIVLNTAEVTDARPPCTADVAFHYHSLWRPGGTTMPHPSTPGTCGSTGCHEVIASPLTFASLSRSLAPVDAR